MTSFIYDNTALPTGKIDRVPSPGPTDQYVTAAEWNTAMQAMLDVRSAVLGGQYLGAQAVYWKNGSGVTQSRSWHDVAGSRLVLAGDAAGSSVWASVTTADGVLSVPAGIKSAGIWNSNGTVGGDIAVKIGTTTADASVASTARLASFGTAIGGSYSEKFWITKNGPVMPINTPFEINGDGGNVRIMYISGTGLAGFSNTAQTAYFGLYPGTGISGSSGPFRSETGTYLAGTAATLTLAGNIGSNSFDIVSKTGTTLADASVNFGAKLWSLRTGLQSSEVEYMYATKPGGGTHVLTIDQKNILNAAAIYMVNPGAGVNGLRLGANDYIGVDTGANDMRIYQYNGSIQLTSGPGATGTSSHGVLVSSGHPTKGVLKVSLPAAGTGDIITAYENTTVKAAINKDGRFDQYGTDSSASPGNATINKPSGISAIASGQTTCTITNSLVPATATRRIKIFATFNQDHGAARHWVTQTAGGGSFVVTLPSAATADAIFSWYLSENV